MTSNRALISIASLLGGVIPGLLVVWLHTQDMRWLLAIGGALPVAAFFLLNNRRTELLWYAFVLGTQAYVSVRILHDRAGSEGIELPLMILLAIGVAGGELLDRDGKSTVESPIRWGGPLAVPILLILATSANSILFSSERFVGVTGFSRLLQFYLVYWVGLNFIRSPERIRMIVHVLAIVLLMQSVVFLVQAATGVTFSLTGDLYADRGVRAGGTVGANSAIYATFVSPIVLLLATRVLSPLVARWERLLLALPLAAGFLSVVLTLRRGAWAGVALGLLWVGFVGVKRTAVFPWVIKVCVGVLIVGALTAPIVSEIVDRYRPDNPMDEAFDERLYLMQIALNVIREHPIAGVGIAAYPHVLKDFVPMDSYDGWISTVHNYYLLVAAETGIAGLLAFVLFLLGAAKLSLELSSSRDSDVRLTAIGLGGAVVSHAFAIAWEPLRDFSPNALLWFLIGMLGAAAHWSNRTIEE